jgi:hypothetical protein
VALSLLKVTLLGILPRFAVKFRAFTVCNYLKPPFWDFLQTLNGNIHISNCPPSLVQTPRQLLAFSKTTTSSTNKQNFAPSFKKVLLVCFNGCMKHLFPRGVTALAALARANFPLERFEKSKPGKSRFIKFRSELYQFDP